MGGQRHGCSLGWGLARWEKLSGPRTPLMIWVSGCGWEQVDRPWRCGQKARVAGLCAMSGPVARHRRVEGHGGWDEH
jgi:hypothetical protein